MADIEKFVYYENGSKKVLKPTDRIVVGSGGLAFEGATSNDFETAIAVTDPTADRTITLPDASGTFLIGSGYSMPASDGSANQVLTTDGSGNVTFSTVDPTTYSSFTTNRVIHANASGVLTASDFLKVDDSNNRFGIGTLTPLTTVEIVGDTAGEAQLSVRQHNNDSDGPDVVFYKSRGTESSKTAIQASDTLTRINSKAYNGTSYVDSGYYGWTASDTSGNSTFTLATRVSGTQAERLGVDSSGNTTISGGLKLSDNVKITLGTGDDLEIFHNGSNNIVKGTGGINVQSGDFKIVKLDGTSTVARFQAVAGIELYHNASKKFETIATGIQTTGTININGAYTFPTSDGSSNQVLTTNGSGTLSFSDQSGGGGFTYSAIDSSSTTSFNVSVSYHYSVDCSSAAVTANLPDSFAAGLSAGDSVRFKLTDNTNNLTLSPNSTNTIDGSNSDRVMSNSQESLTLVWSGNGNWEIV